MKAVVTDGAVCGRKYYETGGL